MKKNSSSLKLISIYLFLLLLASHSYGYTSFSKCSVTPAYTGAGKNIKSLSAATGFLSFSFPEQTGPAAIDTVAHTIIIQVGYGTILSSLTATFTLSPGAACQVNTLAQVSSVTANDFTNPVVYTVTAEDGATTQDWMVTVTLLQPTLMINETDADNASGIDSKEFIELYDGGIGNLSLAGYTVVLFSGMTSKSYASYDLDGKFTDANGYFLLGNAAVENIPARVTAGTGVQFNNNYLRNGADAVALYKNEAVNFPFNTPVTTDSLIDAIVYDTDDADAADLLVLLNSSQPQVNENLNGFGTEQSCQRIPNGSGGLRNTASYNMTAPTPGQQNQFLGSDASLADLSVDSITIPGFSPSVYNYTIVLPFGTAIVPAVTTAPADTNATVVITPAASLPGTSVVTVTSQDGLHAQVYNVAFNLLPPYTGASIISYSIPQQTIQPAIDTVEHTVQVYVPDGTNITALVATFSLSLGAGATVTGVPQVSGNTANDFTNPVVYTVTAQDGATTMDWTVTVTQVPSGDIWLHLLTTGNYTATLGDIFRINMELGQETWNVSDIGFGTSPANPSAYTWTTAAWYEDGTFPNKKVHASLPGSLGTGTFYYAGRAKAYTTDPWHYANNETWSDTAVFAPEYSITVGSIPVPVNCTATEAGSSTISLSWNHDVAFQVVMVVAKLGAALTGSPVQGTAYNVNDNCAGGTVIYKGTLESFNHTPLLPMTSYYYNFYTVNNDYYSLLGGQQIASATTLNNGSDFLTYSITQETGPAIIDTIGHTVTVEVTTGTDLSGLVSTFSLSPGAIASIGATGQVSGVTANDFSNPVIYTITAEDSSTQDWTVTVTLQPVLANDFCQNAVLLNCNTSVAGTTTTATADAVAACGSVAITAPGAWYRFTGTGEQITLSTCDSANFDTKISVYEGTCGALSCIAANDNGTDCAGFTSSVTFNSVNGTDYKILVHGDDNSTGDFVLSMFCSPACTPVPANDNCASAETLNINPPGIFTLTTGSNQCASAALDNPSCNPYGVVQDVWYAFNSGANTSVKLNLTEVTASELSYALYDDCGGSELDCHDSLSSNTQVISGLTPSADYLLQVWSGGDAYAGMFNIGLNEFGHGAEIISFTLPQQTLPAVIDTLSHTVEIAVLYGTSVNGLIPSYVLSMGAAASVDAITQVSGITSVDFSVPVTYTITAEDGTTLQDWVVTVIVAPLTVLINEADADNVGFNNKQFVEIYDGGVGNTDLSGYTVVFYDGADNLSYASLGLSGLHTDEDGYFLLGNAAVENLPARVAAGTGLQFMNNLIESGPDAVALYQASVTNFPNNTPVTITNLLDAIVYCTSDPEATGLMVLLNAGQSQIDENMGGHSDVFSCQRIPNGSGGLRNTDTYTVTEPTPGEANHLAGTEASLADLTIDGVTVNGFAPDVFTYSVTLPYGTTVVPLVNGIPADSNATVIITNATVMADTAAIFVTADDGINTNTYYVMFEVAEADTGTDIITFSIPLQTVAATIDTALHTVQVYVPSGTDLSALVASFTLSLGASAEVLGNVQESGVTVNNFTGTVTYSIAAEDSIATQNWLVSVTPVVTGDIWDHLLTTGNQSTVLGDVYWINMEIGQPVWDGSDIGFGTDTVNPALFDWNLATWYADGSFPNKQVHTQIPGTMGTGVFYFAGRARANVYDPWHYANTGTWANTPVFAPIYTITVAPIPQPVNCLAVAASYSAINLTWTKDAYYQTVMVVAKEGSDITGGPLQGIAYNINDVCSDGFVIYTGTLESFVHNGLNPGTSYFYKFFTVNNNYYSPAGSANASTQVLTDLSIIFPTGFIQACDLTDTTSVPLSIKNSGSEIIPSGSNVYGTYQVDGGTPVTQSFVLPDDLLPGDSVMFYFSATYDFSAIGVYDYILYINYFADEYPSNDTSYGQVEHYQLPVDISGGDTIIVPVGNLPYILTTTGAFDLYYWSDSTGLYTGTSATFDANSYGWYYVTVTSEGCSASDSVFVDEFTGNFHNVNNALNLSVYPNPSNGIFNLTISGISGNLSVELINYTGHVIRQFVNDNRGIYSEIIDFSGLLKGIYLVKVRDNNNLYFNKIVIQ